MSTVTVPATVVPLLREELLRETSSAADLLCQLTAPRRLADERGFQESSWRLDATRAVLAHLGLVAPTVEMSVELRVDEYAVMAYKAAIDRNTRASQRAEDLRRERPGEIPPSLPELADFVGVLGRALNAQGNTARLRRHLLDD